MRVVESKSRTPEVLRGVGVGINGSLETENLDLGLDEGRARTGHLDPVEVWVEDSPGTKEWLHSWKTKGRKTGEEISVYEEQGQTW